jgi:2-hydroxychromene-2-carboxylate isomerase
MSTRPILFYFDFLSPYAYLGCKRIRAAAREHGWTVEPTPVLFAALLDAWGQKGPAEIEPKRLYTFKHALRLAKDVGVPLRPPPSHPFNPLLALRVCALDLDPTPRWSVVERLFDLTWGTGEGVESESLVVAALDELGLTGADLVEQAKQPAAKQALREFTERARDKGVFGVPTFEVDGELFWGQDTIGHIERFLAGNDPVPPDLAERWGQIGATARRSGARPKPLK